MLKKQKCSEAVIAYDNKRCFGQSICSMIQQCNTMKQSVYDTDELSRAFGINKRRLFDVVGVLNAIGCVHKIGTSKLVWEGLDKYHSKELEFAKNFGVFDSKVPLSKLIFTNEDSSISELTNQLLTLFFALNCKTLNIQDVAKFICRDSNNVKKLLSKMYQITHILNSIGFITRTSVYSEIQLNDKYFITMEPNPMSVESLLNRSNATVGNYYSVRRSEFYGGKASF